MNSAATPGFEDGDIAALFAAARSAVQAVLAATAQTLTARDALAAEQEWEQLHRMVGAAQIDNLTRIDAERLYRIDGHRSVKAHARHVLKISSEEASRRAKAARALRDLPEVAAALRSGRIGLDHVQLLARVQANPRIKGKVPARQEKFLRTADEESFDGFKDKVLDWERATDMNGGFKDNERNHANRNVRLIHNSIEGIWELSGHFAADQGARAKEIFDHYIDAEWRADWAEARARLGDAVTASALKRTDAQRRADAFIRMCNDAAGAPPGTTAPKITHNIVWSADAYLGLADLLGADAAALDTHWSASLTDLRSQRAAWCDPDTYRCSTLDVVPFEPVEQFFSSLANHVRRVVVSTKGAVIEPGQRGTAVRIPNRWKQKQFSVTRDPVTGRWRTYRPDGSEIA